MGGFVSAVGRFVCWVGDCICSVARWFFRFVDYVGGIVKRFIFGIEDTIKKADNPKNFGEAAATRKEGIEFRKKERETYNKLSRSDQERLDKLLPIKI